MANCQGRLQPYRDNSRRIQLRKRELIVGDALHVLKNGHIYIEPEASTLPGFYKYKVEIEYSKLAFSDFACRGDPIGM